METKIESKVIVKLFIGTLLTREIKTLLQGSPSWKQVSIGQQDPVSSLILTHYQNHEYLGRFLERDPIALNEVRNDENLIRSTLSKHCPSLNPSAISIVIFPQILVS